MKIVYNELVTVESDLHKAYYHVEDFDLNEWDIAFKRANGNGLMSCEHDSENSNVIVTIEADKQSASAMANTLVLSCLLSSSFEDFEISKSDDDYVVFSFCSHLSPQFLLYIYGQLDEIDDCYYQNEIDSIESEVRWETWRDFAREWGLEKFLGYLSIHLDPDSLNNGEEILSTGSPSDFREWMNSVTSGMEMPDKKTILYKMISRPFIDSFYQDGVMFDDYFYKVLSSCRKSYAKEYNSWRKLERLQRSNYKMSSLTDILYRGKLSLE